MKSLFFRHIAIFFAFILSFHLYANAGWIPAVNYYLMQPTPTVAPKITGQKNLSYNEESFITLNSSDFSVADSDSINFSIDIFAGENYEIKNGKIVPSEDFFGNLIVNVKANDGINLSELFATSITVLNINDAPTSKSIVFNLSNSETKKIYFDELFFDADRDTSYSEFNFHVNSVSNTADLTTDHGKFLRDESSGRLSYIYSPKAGFHGQDIVTYWVSDNLGAISSEGQIIFNVTQSSTPVIVAQDKITLNEDSQIILQAEMYEIIDYDSSYHTIIPLEGSNYTLSGSSIIPRKDFYGKIIVPVTVSDGTNTSSSFLTEIDVKNVNDPPKELSPYSFNIKNDQSVLFYLTGLFHDVDGVNDSTRFYLIVNGTLCNTRCSSLHGEVMKVNDLYWASYIYVPNKGFSGSDYITYSIMDSDGALSSNSRIYFNVTGPQILKILSNQALNFDEDNAFQLSVGDFTLSGAEEGATTTLTILSGTNYTVANGLITPKKDFYGVLDVNVIATSNNVSSGVYVANVTINNVNDPPAMLSGSKSYSGTMGNAINGISASELFTDTDLAGGAESLALFTVQWVDKNRSTNGVTSHGTLTRSGAAFVDSWIYQPAADFSGSDTVLAWVTDSKGAQASAPVQIVFNISPGGTVQPVTFTPDGGSYSEQQSVSLSSLTPAAEIRYSIDGTDVTAASALYTAPVVITSSTTMKAKAFKAGMLDSTQSAASFILTDPELPVMLFYHYDENGRLLKITK